MRTEEVICMFCNATIKVNVPDKHKITEIFREKSNHYLIHPYGCPKCKEVNYIRIDEPSYEG
jgi:hypothetical protein